MAPTKSATPKPPQRKVIQQSSAVSTLILAVKILLILLILLLLPKLVQGKSKSGRRRRSGGRVELKALKRDCESMECARLIPEERMNCLLDCMSPKCFQQIYAEQPLEDGEIDYDRYKEFEQCLKEDIKAQNNKKLER